MGVLTSHRPGTFSWVDLAAHDVDVAERYYTQLFGWKAERMPYGSGPDEVYVMLRKDGHDAAALYSMDATQKSQGMPSTWLSYVTVKSVDRTAARAGELGATILADAFDVMDVGRMALIGDPTGAMFAAWEPRKHIGAGIKDQAGSLCWNELATRDLAGASSFYAALFGWTPVPFEDSPVPYTMMMNGETPVGGLYSMLPGMEGVPPHWAPYFAVEDTDDALRRSESLGGAMVAPPDDIPGIGRLAGLRDPQGGTFWILAPPRP